MYYVTIHTTYPGVNELREKAEREGSKNLDFSFVKKQEAYGTCSCREKFPIPFDDHAELYEREQQIRDTAKGLTCPKCGAPYGQVVRKTSQRPITNADGKESMLERGSSSDAILTHVHASEDGSLVFIQKEQAHGTGEFFGGHSDVTISLIPVPHVTSIRMDGREKSLAMRNISSVLSNIYAPDILGSFPPQFRDELRWVSRVMGDTTSLSTAISALVRWPALDGLWQRYKKEDGQDGAGHWTMPKNSAQDVKEMIKAGTLRSKEKDLRKAVEFPLAVLDVLFKGDQTVSAARALQIKYGRGPLLELVQTCERLGLYNDAALSFAELYSSVNTESRKRLAAYLSHDVAVYQGIEDPKEAWDILRDYRKMCKDMEIKPQFCPRSLKLAHDITARNYKLSFDEIERKKFQEAVASDRYERLGWISKDKTWQVVVPTDPGDIVQEGKLQSHCVASYISYVLQGKYRICFLRRTADPEKPVLTLTVDNDDECVYYKGFDNRAAYPDEHAALEEWTKAEGLTLAAVG